MKTKPCPPAKSEKKFPKKKPVGDTAKGVQTRRSMAIGKQLIAGMR